VSRREKPDPDTVTFDPTCDEVGLNEIDALSTVKVEEAKSLPGLPATVIVYAPGVIEVTLNAAETNPFEIEHLNVPIGLPDSEQPVSVV